jgi:hypothetical protein
MDLQRCPTCGSELACDDGLTYTYCVSAECGAVFHDLRLQGMGTRLGHEPASAAGPAASRSRSGTGPGA